MRGDFTRAVFDSRKHYSRVLMQQGRVLLDHDFNAQADIQQHYLRALARDLIGRHGGPHDKLGFTITPNFVPGSGPFDIGKGHYYVDGILCENDRTVAFRQQDALYDPGDKPKEGPYLAYLDVWERLVTSYQDPLLREVALGGPDTTARTEVVWQVRLYPLKYPNPLGDSDIKKIFRHLRGTTPQLKARALGEEGPFEPCGIDPGSRYRGVANQLYRVEIHHGGAGAVKAAANGRGGPAARAVAEPGADVATFKWSRDNGAVAVFPVAGAEGGGGLVLGGLGRDERSGLAPGQWVELTDDDHEYSGRDGRPLRKVRLVDPATDLVVTDGSFGADPARLRNPLLRRWDQTAARGPLSGGAVPVVKNTWLELEDGVQVWFSASGTYRPGDHWLIPARVETGDVEWPKERTQDGERVPVLREPHGIRHHYAPLYQFELADPGGLQNLRDLRRRFRDLCDLTAKQGW